MALIHRRSLRQQIIAVTFLASTIAIVAAWGLMFGIELTTLRTSIVNDLQVKADIIGNQCSAALLFNVRKDAEETLAALRADPHIEYAAVLSETGEPFAQYWRVDVPLSARHPASLEAGYDFDNERVALYHVITLQGKRIGVVTIQSDLLKLRAVLVRYLRAGGVILAISLVVAYVLASRLQRKITKPVGELVDTMQRISESKDFSVRATEPGVNELGSMARGFNEMLATIQDRDKKLTAHRGDLERTVSDLQRLAGELQEANQKLKTLDEMKSNFISVASHELRTPLTSIKAFVELMIMKPNMDADRKFKLLGVINSESDRLTRLINDLLNLSRIESGSMSWHMAGLSISEIIQTAIDNLLALADDKGLRLSVLIDPGLPAIRGDRDRLLQVVTNIVSNAIKFTTRGGTIEVSAGLAHSERPEIMVSVKDNGIGIPEKDLEIIFEKFHRSGDIMTSSIEGSGLGLTIAREIIDYHGGRIWAESIYGSGSTFTFTLPVNRRRRP